MADLREQLQRVEVEAADMAALAMATRLDQSPSQARQRQFAVALHRHAKGARAAAAAWRQELAHQT